MDNINKYIVIMKRNFILTGLMAVISLAACQRESEVTTPNPTYDPVTNTVKTDFILNVSTNTGKDTKTTAEFAQVNSPFLGMDEVHLLAYDLDFSNTKHGPFYFRTKDTKGNKVAASRDFNLGTLLPANSVNSTNASRTIELSLPLGTNCVVLYGKALKTHSDDLQGKTDASGDPADLSTLTFALSPRLTNHAAFEAGSYFFSRMLTCFILSGKVNEKEGGFWGNATGIKDNSFAFWYPIPSDEVAEKLPANPTDQQTAVSDVDGNTYTFYRGQLSWKQLGTMYDYMFDGSTVTDPNKFVKTENATNGVYMTLAPLNEVLGEAYSALVNIKSNSEKGLVELRAGSASAVLRIAQDLYAVVERVAGATATSWEEEAARQLGVVIKEKMEQFFVMKNGTLNFLSTAGGNVDVAALITALGKNTKPDEYAANLSILSTYLDESYFPGTSNEGFPVNVGLPFGGAIMTSVIDADQHNVDTFQYTEDIPAYGFGTSTFPIANYRYPAELMYYGNSAIRVSKETKSSYPLTIDSWNSPSSWDSSWENFSAVKSDTRSVAMVNNINYGTALLESTVTFGDTQLKDNNHELHPTEEDNVLNVSSFTGDQGIFVTGVVVGGQADKVGWEYLRLPTSATGDPKYDATTKKFTGGLDFSGNAFDKMIYDKVLSTYKVGETSQPLYTLVWDNYDCEKAADSQSDVYIGLELVNKTGQDLWGEMNLIRNGGTFYLLGKMDLATAVASARAKEASAFTDLEREYYCYPPYDPETGNTINAPRVFMQDYVTKASLVLGKDALKHAYVTVPDLRSGQVSLGMSIDMDWTPGLAFDVEMGWLAN